MSFLDTFRKSKEATAPHTTPPPAGHTLSEILNDNNKSDLFSKLLEREGDQDLAARIQAKSLTEADVHLLEERRKVFSEKITLSEKTEKFLTKDKIIAFARKHPDFEELINLHGPEKAIKVIQGQLKEISITDESRFNSLVSEIDTITSFESGEYKRVNDEVEKLLVDSKILPEQYQAALAITDPLARQMAISKLVPDIAEKRTGWKSVLDFFHTKKVADYATSNKLNTAGTLMEATLDQLNAHEGDMGALLFATLNQNDTMRNALSAELIGERAPGEPKIGIKKAREGAIDTKQIDEEMDEDWHMWKRDKDYDNPLKTDIERKSSKKEFLRRAQNYYREENDRGQSFWEQAFAAFTDTFIKDKVKKLK